MKPYNFIFTYLSILVLLLSCGDNNTDKQTTSNNTDNKLVIGKITQKVKCSSNPQYTYTYYLPMDYNTNKKYPVIMIFDAHARAYLSINRFKPIADEYAYILIASESSYNGMKEINTVVNSLWQDAMQMFSIDNKRVYTAGFSGGAKVAASVAIYKGGVSGVIACGAGMPNPKQVITNKFDYAAVVGLDDFNYQEISSLDTELHKNGFNTHLFVFDGTHEWPSSKVLEKAVLWLSIMNMKKSPQYIDNQILRTYSDICSDTINKLFADNKLFASYKHYTSFIEDMEGLYDISEYRKNYKKLANEKQVKSGLKNEQTIKAKELEEQELILSYFKSSNYNKIQSKINALIKGNKADRHLNKRLINFISMITYIYTKASIDSQNIDNFNNLIKIYDSIKANKAYVDFFRALQFAMQNKLKLALQYLQQAVNNGYYDVKTLSNTAYFNELKKMPEFDLILQKAEDNQLRK